MEPGEEEDKELDESVTAFVNALYRRSMMDQKEFAYRIGVDRSELNGWLKGGGLNARSLFKVIRASGLTLDLTRILVERAEQEIDAVETGAKQLTRPEPQ